MRVLRPLRRVTSSCSPGPVGKANTIVCDIRRDDGSGRSEPALIRLLLAAFEQGSTFRFFSSESAGALLMGAI